MAIAANLCIPIEIHDQYTAQGGKKESVEKV
jgi:hypothetical protein